MRPVEFDDDDVWGEDPSYFDPLRVEVGRARPAQPAGVDRARVVRGVALVILVLVLVFGVPAAVRWARDGLAGITQIDETEEPVATTTAPPATRPLRPPPPD